MSWILVFIIIFIIYQLIKPKANAVKKMSAFDDYLIQHHKESQKRADSTTTVIPNENTKLKNNSWTEDLYLGMIKSDKYDTTSLRKEAMEEMNVTEKQLDELLEQYKSNKKN
jgi:hypothetical protein